MKIPLSWVSIFCDLQPLFKKYSTEELAHLFSIHTAEIDDVQVVGMDKIVVAKVLSAQKHPDSDHLNIVSVDAGNGAIQIVCGATNVIGAKYVPLAQVGAMMGGREITKAQLRGQESNGMICSLDELGLDSERSEGIFPLESVWSEDELASKIGTPFFDLTVGIPDLSGKEVQIPLWTTTFEIDNKFITNRPDLFSVEGNAREFGAIWKLPVTTYDFHRPQAASEGTGVEIRSEKVLSYSLDVYENVPTGTLPFGMTHLMRCADMTVKMDIVDLTNYIITELGQPMHAFDADAISGKIIVREALDGEQVEALNGETYTLCKNDLVIADEQKVLAIAGVMGGASSAISPATKRIAVESACFDAVGVRLTAQRLGLRSDASMRYEKSLDPLLAFKGAARFKDLLVFLKKDGQLIAHSHFLQEKALKHIDITVSYDFLNKKIGLEIPQADSRDILTRLGFTVSEIDSENIRVSVPSWRATKDVSIREDLAEEVGRVYGYEQVVEKPLTGAFVCAPYSPTLAFRDLCKTYWSQRSIYEVYNYSFASLEQEKMAGWGSESDAIRILNSANQEYSYMRRSLFIRLLDNITKFKEKEQFGLFEWGKIFKKWGENDFSEDQNACGVLVGYSLDEAKALLSGFFGTLTHGQLPAYNQSNENTTPKCFHPAQSAHLLFGGVPLITFGALHPRAAINFDLKDKNILLFEIHVEAAQSAWETTNYLMQDFSRFPSIPRELNFVLPTSQTVYPIIELITSCDARIHSIGVVDVFVDAEKVGADKKSVTFSFILQDHEKTITDEEALSIQNNIIDTLTKKGFPLRGI